MNIKLDHLLKVINAIRYSKYKPGLDAEISIVNGDEDGNPVSVNALVIKFDTEHTTYDGKPYTKTVTLEMFESSDMKQPIITKTTTEITKFEEDDSSETLI